MTITRRQRVHRILDFSKIEAGRLELERSRVALPELTEGVCATLLPMATGKDVELGVFVSPQHGRIPDQADAVANAESGAAQWLPVDRPDTMPAELQDLPG